MRKLLVVTAAVALLGCGARSDLLATDDAPTTASGGSGGDGGGMGGEDPTGGGGAGGAPLDCAVELVVDGPIAIAGGLMAHQRQPALVPVDDDEVVMALEWTDASFPDAPREVRHNAFTPWGTFPSGDVGPTFLADFDRGQSLKATTSTNGRFALLMTGGPGPFEEPTFNPFFVPGSGDVPPGLSFGQSDEIAFASHDGNGRFLLGWRQLFGPGAGLLAAVVQLTGNDQVNLLSPPQLLGCSPGAVTADASWNGNRWVVVTSTGKPSAECQPPGPPPPGPPEIVQSMFIDTNGNVTFTGNEPTTIVDRLALVEVDGGHYAFWTGLGDALGGPLLTRRMDEDGDPEGEAFPLPGLDDAVVGALWNVGRFGQGFLVTWQSGVDGAVHARRYDENASPLGEVGLPSAMAGRPDVLGDPSGERAALVAFPIDSGPSDQMRLHRVRCP